MRGVDGRRRRSVGRPTPTPVTRRLPHPLSPDCCAARPEMNLRAGGGHTHRRPTTLFAILTADTWRAAAPNMVGVRHGWAITGARPGRSRFDGPAHGVALALVVATRSGGPAARAAAADRLRGAGDRAGGLRRARHSVLLLPLPRRRRRGDRAGTPAALESLRLQRLPAARRWADRALLAAELAFPGALALPGGRAQLGDPAAIQHRGARHLRLRAGRRPRAGGGLHGGGLLRLRRLHDRAGDPPLDHGGRGIAAGRVARHRARVAPRPAPVALDRHAPPSPWRSN